MLQPTFFIISLDLLTPAQWNNREDDDVLKEKLKEDINKGGYFVNIMVREVDEGKYEVINGNYKYYAIKELGFKEVMVCNIGNITLQEAKRINTQINEANFESNNYEISEILLRLMTQDEEILDELISVTYLDCKNSKKIIDYE